MNSYSPWSEGNAVFEHPSSVKYPKASERQHAKQTGERYDQQGDRQKTA
jgi:hypothetical protein